MILILFAWINVTFLAFSFGKLVEYLAFRPTGLKVTPFLSCIVGLIVINLAIELWAIASPVNFSAQLIIEILAMGIFIWLYKKDRLIDFKIEFSALAIALWVLFAYVFLFVWIKCYYPTSHYDEGLYYIQHLRWLQKFGFVPGLANLHHRLGFHSAWHDLAAFFDYPSTSYFFNDLNGVLFLFFTGYAFSGILSIAKKDYSLSNFLKLFSWLVLMYPHTDMVSIHSYIFVNTISPDWASYVFVATTFILFAEYHERPEPHRKAFSLLVSLIALYCFSIKISNVAILLIPCYFAIRQIKAWSYQEFILLAISSILFLSPWIIGNAILSGYLVFPITLTDLHLPWSVPNDYLDGTVEFTKVWAKTGGKVEVFKQLSTKDLYAFWFQNQSVFMKGVYVVIASSFVVFSVLLVIRLLISKQKFFNKEVTPVYVLFSMGLIGSAFWFANAPDFRFSAIFLLVVVFLLLYFFLRLVLQNFHLVFYALLLATCFHFKFKITKEQIADAFKENGLPLIQKVELTQQNDIYVPSSTDQCFDSALPCTANYEMQKGNIQFRDQTSIGSGFYIKD